MALATGSLAPNVSCVWSLVQAEGRNLYRVECNTKGGLRFFLLRIPCTVLDSGKVRLGKLDYTDNQADALYLPLDLAQSIVTLLSLKGPDSL